MRPEVTISDSQIRLLAERMGRRAAVRSYNVAVFAADEMESEVVSIVAEEFINDRAEHRRKGTLPLIQSFMGVVIGNRGELPVSARLTTVPGADNAKVASLEFGADPHEIAPHGNGLAFPKGRDKWSQAYDANSFWTPSPVQHPGNQAYGFMRRARGRARLKMQQYAYRIR